jgi:RNA polymerase sigma factor (sigma-70 family)
VRAEREAYEELFRACYPSVLRSVVLITRDRARAEEVCQEAFLALLQRWSVVSEYERPEAWVRTVAVRAALKTVRRDARRSVLEIVRHRPADHVMSIAWPDVDLARALADLPAKQRAAVVLHYLEDLPVADVARVLEVSESTVKQHLFRARHRLASALGEEVMDHVDR